MDPLWRHQYRCKAQASPASAPRRSSPLPPSIAAPVDGTFTVYEGANMTFGGLRGDRFKQPCSRRARARHEILCTLPALDNVTWGPNIIHFNEPQHTVFRCGHAEWQSGGHSAASWWWKCGNDSDSRAFGALPANWSPTKQEAGFWINFFAPGAKGSS